MSFFILKLDVPGVPSSVVIEEEGSRHLKIKWKGSKDSNAPITRYIIVYQPSETQIDNQGSQKISRIMFSNFKGSFLNTTT